MKLVSWDLECSNLKADFGLILTAGWKTVGKGRPKVITVYDYDGDILEAEGQLVKDLSDELLKADCWLTWYGARFDLPFLNSRLLWHGLPVLPRNFPHIDGWRTAKYGLGLSSNRLNTVQQFLGLEDKKTHLMGPQWIRALAGDNKAMQYIAKHNYQDVLVLEQAYERLRPLIIDHPHLGLEKGSTNCPVCGKDKLQKRGFHLTRTRKYQRYQCTNCGSWTKGTVTIKTELK